MRLDKIKRSSNVEDRRRVSGGKKAAGGIGAIIMALIAIFVLKQDPAQVVQQAMQNSGKGSGADPQREFTAEEEALQEHVAKVLQLTEDVWDEIYPYAAEKFRGQSGPYVKPKLVSFSGQVRSACGLADAGMGPFYCPGDQQVYIDLAFYDELKKKFKAPGDFAQAYVVAHEVGHHVQKLLGFSDFVHKKRQTVGKEEYNQLSVKLELQADYFAGVWANRAQKKYQVLEEGDIEEGLRAAGAVGDDTIQKRAQGYVVPESFTHGTAEQRIKWFTLGLKSGDPRAHNPFDVAYQDL
jgi:predicted metalloprotease